MTHLEKAQELRARTDIHFNCCQSVLIPFARELGLTEEQAYAMGAHFGSGMHCGSACGTVTGALMALGLAGRGEDQPAALLHAFREKHGELSCPALLKKSHDAGIPRKDHCDNLVYETVSALEELIRPQK